MDDKARLKRAQEEILKVRLDALLVTHLPNLRYLCEFSGSAGVLIVGEGGATFFTDGRYTEQAREEVRGAAIRILKGKSALAAATEWLGRQSRVRRIGIETAHLTIADRNTFAKALPRGARLVEAPPIVERLRMVKDEEEVAKIRAACHLGVKLFAQLTEALRPGVAESEAAGVLEFAARKAGAEQMAFTTIIAGGARSALPHGRASAARLPPNGFVVCDFGVILAGYCSDMTRTVHLGRASAEERRAYEAVREAQQAALEAVKPGTTVGEVDSAARKLLQQRELHKFFTHSTGHGLGLEVHEAPRVAARQTEPLVPGMVITIEPGIYLPGKFGIRIEDTIVVTETGCEVLTPCSKELAII
jgi:Xaa-Pro aminopeptidase